LLVDLKVRTDMFIVKEKTRQSSSASQLIFFLPHAHFFFFYQKPGRKNAKRPRI